MKYVVAIDIGGTSTRVALLNEKLEICKKTKFKTDTLNAEKTVIKITKAIEAFAEKIEKIGLSCPGPFNINTGTILQSPNLQGTWKNFSIVKAIEQRTNTKVIMENDANLAALGEYAIRSQEAYRHLYYITVSTGIGAGEVVDGEIITGFHHHANEVANVCLWEGGPQHGLIVHGGVEAICSGTAIAERYSKVSKMRTTTEEVFQLAKQGNEKAKKVIDDAKVYLSNFIAAILCIRDPEIIILGGSVALHGEGFLDEMIIAVKAKLSKEISSYVCIEKSSLGEDNGLYGAAYLAWKK